MIKVMHIITRLDMGGSAQNTLQTCIGLSGTGTYRTVLVHGLALESQMTAQESRIVREQIEIAERRGVRVVPCAPMVRRIDPIKDWKTFCFLLQILKIERPDIVHTHSSKAGILGRLAAWFLKVPAIVHTTHGHVFYGHFGPVASKIFLVVERIVARITDVMVALTEGERRDYIQFNLCPEEKTATIHSGVDIGPFLADPNSYRETSEQKRALGLKAEHPVIGTVGWLLPIKGPMVLLNAFGIVRQEYPGLQLVYVGKGDMREVLEAEAERMVADGSVHFLGWREDIHRIIPAFDLFVLPSLNEGMGRVLVEAMAAGKPIVASDTGGIPDLVIHEHNGLLVPPGDVSSLSDAIAWMLRNPDQAERMGRNGGKECSRYTLETMLEKVDGLYQELFLTHDVTNVAPNV